ncbi:MAG: MerR family transcriptional regulator [Tissierellales bacterium]
MEKTLDLELTPEYILSIEVMCMLIGEVSKKYDIGIETLRYYDKIGLLTVKRKNNNRFYTEEDINKLHYIMAMKDLMFTLDDIKRILEVDERIDVGLAKGFVDGDDISIILNEIRIKYDEIFEKEKQLMSVKKHLEKIIIKIEEIQGGNKNE